MNGLAFSWLEWALIGVAGTVVLAGILYLIFRRRPTAEEIERRRRAHVNQVGRIAEGRVDEILEAAPEPEARSALFGKKKEAARLPNGARKLIHYTYSVSGVTYTTAQDVTDIDAPTALHLLVAGQSASVKYDPANPGNSILIADDWSGVR